jgi:D-ribose pyranase
MLKSGILNPALLELLGRFRHTNRIVIADRGFPSVPGVHTIDISLVDDVPTVRQVLRAVVQHCTIGAAWMAEELRAQNPDAVVREYEQVVAPTVIYFEPHYTAFKTRVPSAIGIVRTGDTTPFGNIVLESA